MIVTKQMVNDYIKAHAKIEELENKGVESQAEKVCKALGHTGFDKIEYCDDCTVDCLVYYSGCGADTFCFPTKLLLMTGYQLKKYVKEEKERKKKEQEQDRLKREKQKEKDQKDLYLKLKQKYERTGE